MKGGAPAEPIHTSSGPPPEDQEQEPGLTEWGSILREKGYPSAESLATFLGLKEKTEDIEGDWMIHCLNFGEERDPQVVRDVLHWFPGSPSKKKGGQPYWSFVNSMPLLTKHWDEMEKQCIEDLNGSRRLRSVK